MSSKEHRPDRSRTPESLASLAAPVEIALDLSLGSAAWRLQKAVVRGDAYPLVHLLFESTGHTGVQSVRLDLHKAMLLEPPPEGVELSDGQLAKLAQFIGRNLHRR